MSERAAFFMPQLAPREWSRQANKLQIKAGRPLDRADLIKELGKPNGKVTRAQSIEKGGRWKPRTGNRSKQAEVRGRVSVLTPQMPQESLLLKLVNKHGCKVSTLHQHVHGSKPLLPSMGKISRLAVSVMIKTCLRSLL